MNELSVFARTLSQRLWEREKPIDGILDALKVFLNQDAAIYYESASSEADGELAPPYGSSQDAEKRVAFVRPVMAGAERIGAIVIYGGVELSEAGKAACEICALMAALIASRSVCALTEDRLRIAVDSLSHTELEAAIAVLNELNGKEGVIVASAVSKRENITRSSIVNALRKLESAGLVESRSLGSKGTYILVKNDLLFKWLGKFNKVR
ncbi:MAG: hypothetical protein LBL35_05940 [Clostridiales bacterium]|jgi:transcriptional pleiotropic repressor|nr:hypothetical protein [Clostridiales bacterium]